MISVWFEYTITIRFHENDKMNKTVSDKDLNICMDTATDFHVLDLNALNNIVITALSNILISKVVNLILLRHVMGLDRIPSTLGILWEYILKLTPVHTHNHSHLVELQKPVRSYHAHYSSLCV